MPHVLRHSIPHCLRLLALAVLVLGLLAKPLVVAGCELDDMRGAQGASGASGLQSTTDDGGDTCCPGRACGECCTATPAMPAHAIADPAMAPGGHPQVAAWVESEPAPLPVASRPPIAA